MGWGYWNLAIISWYIGWLCVGINSQILPWFLIGFYSQFYLRKYKADWFIKYNYILSAGMDGESCLLLIFVVHFLLLPTRMRFPLPFEYERIGANGVLHRWNPSHGIHHVICVLWCIRKDSPVPRLLGKQLPEFWNYEL